MFLIGYLIVNVAAILITAYLVPGFVIENWQAAIVAAVVIGTINTFVKPILKLITFPITLITLGLFSLVINVGLLMLAANVTPGFSIDGIMTALIGSIVLSLVASLLGMFTK